MLRPIRPKPLMPTFVVIQCPHSSTPWWPARLSGQRPTVMLGGATRGVGRVDLQERICHLLKPAQSMVDRGLGEFHSAGELTKVELRVGRAPACHLTRRGGQSIEPAGRLQPFDGRSLPEA